MNLINTIFAGPQNCGKSTLINLILKAVPDQNVIVIGDVIQGHKIPRPKPGTVVFIETQDINFKVKGFQRVIIEPRRDREYQRIIQPDLK